MNHLQLIRIADLVGQNVAGLKADIRTRNADGSFKYGEDLVGSQPKIVTMTVVEMITKPNCKTLARISGREKDAWLYWRFEGYSCGYSGTWAGMNDHLNDYLMIEKPA